MPWTHH